MPTASDWVYFVFFSFLLRGFDWRLMAVMSKTPSQEAQECYQGNEAHG